MREQTFNHEAIRHEGHEGFRHRGHEEHGECGTPGRRRLTARFAGRPVVPFVTFVILVSFVVEVSVISVFSVAG